MVANMAAVFTQCLRRGLFPDDWKMAQLILIPKGQAKPGDVPKARPIALISESGKILECIIVKRMRSFMQEETRAKLSENQFGFRPGLLTVDALFRVREQINDALNSGGVALAISLNIKNAFNSLPWETINAALGRSKKRFPGYIRKIIDSYLRNR